MPLLQYIKKITNYKFFSDFNYDTKGDLKEFSAYNIIYGFNGCGKSTLSNFFRCLSGSYCQTCEKNHENQIACPKDPSSKISFKLEFKEETEKGTTTTSFTQKMDLQSLPTFKVFHCDYVKQTIQTKKLNHIYILGADHGELLSHLEASQTELQKIQTDLAVAYNNIETLEKRRDKLGTEVAQNIKEAIQFPYNRTNFSKDIVKFSKTILSAKEITLYTNQVKSKALPSIIPEIPQFTLDFSFENFKELLSQSPSNIVIESFRKNPKLNNWAEEGLSIHKDSVDQRCHFCDSFILPERLEILRKHFDDSYSHLKNGLSHAIDKINLNIETLHNQINNSTFFKFEVYEELKEEYLLAQISVKENISKNIDSLEIIKRILEEKKENIIETFEEYDQELLDAINVINSDASIYQEIKSIFEKHNEITKNFDEIIKSAQSNLKSHILTHAFSEYEKITNEILLETTNISTLNNRIQELHLQISDYEAKAKNYIVIKDKINQDILDFFGRQEITLIANDNHYEIMRNGQRIDRLSTGEENALALIYFFNSLDDKDTSIKDTIIVLDDPISSFDTSFYYHAIAYIYKKTVSCKQVFIFTHKFSFFKQLLKTYTSPNSYVLKRMNGNPALLNPDDFINNYVDEYAFFFSLIYEFVATNTQDKNYLYMPNIGRQILESFLAFKIPHSQGSDLLDLALKLDGDTVQTRAIVRLLHTKSHHEKLKGIDSSASFSSLEEVKQTLYSLLSFIRKHDEKHFSYLEDVLPQSIPRLFSENHNQSNSPVLIPTEVATILIDDENQAADNTTSSSEYTLAAHRKDGINELSHEESEQINKHVDYLRNKYKK